MMGHRSFSDENIPAADPAASREGGGGVIAIGGLRFDRADRSLTGATGETRLEPRVGQLLALLAERRGEVIRREELQRALWPNAIVGEDSLNRLVGGLRRALREVGGDQDARIETISKSGYRLIAALDDGGAGAATRLAKISRRGILALASGVTAATVGALWWANNRTAGDPRVARLIEQARVAQGSGLPEADATGLGFLNEALAIDADNAAAWGLLALAHYRRLENGEADERQGTAECELAARRALALDPDESSARAALAILPPIYGDWLAAERRYDAVLRADPANLAVTVEKGVLMMSVGRVREALVLAERALALSPFAPLLHYHRAFRLWAAGQPWEADAAIDRAAQLWPQHPGIRYARFLIFAGSGREGAALRMLDEPAGEAPLPPPLARTWRPILQARIAPRVPGVGRATAAMLVGQARAHTAAAVNAILGLSLLGAIDEAFEVARGNLLRQGPGIGNLRTPGAVPAAEQRWRKTMMLFVPPTAPMRSDPRFAGLVEDMGLADYWRRSGKAPDYRAS